MTEQELDAFDAVARQQIFETLNDLRASGHVVRLDADTHVIIAPPVHDDLLACLDARWHDVQVYIAARA